MENPSAHSFCVLVDSNVYIGLLRRRVDPVKCLGQWIGNNDLATCGMVRLEVERGIRLQKVRRLMGGFFDVMRNAPATEKVWSSAADLAWKLDRQGIALPAQDLLIASCALNIGAAVLSDDAHFLQIPELTVLRPRDELEVW
jgi:predicted nucleic acid-binding protein